MLSAGRSSDSGNGTRRSLGRLPVLLVAGLLTGGALAACQPAESGQVTADQEQAIADTLRSLVGEIDAAWSRL